MTHLKTIKRLIPFVLIILMTLISALATVTHNDNSLTTYVTFWNETGYDEYIASEKNTLGVDITTKFNFWLKKTKRNNV